MRTPSCPFHVECLFHNSPLKTPSDEMLVKLYCHVHHGSCEIAKRMLAGKPVPSGACPDANVAG
jgi:hypothetical protein